MTRTPVTTTTLPERLARIVNLKEFAEKAELSRVTLHRIKQGQQSPNVQTVFRIEEALRKHKPKMRPAAEKADAS